MKPLYMITHLSANKNKTTMVIASQSVDQLTQWVYEHQEEIMLNTFKYPSQKEIKDAILTNQMLGFDGYYDYYYAMCQDKLL